MLTQLKVILEGSYTGQPQASITPTNRVPKQYVFVNVAATSNSKPYSHPNEKSTLPKINKMRHDLIDQNQHAISSRVKFQNHIIKIHRVWQYIASHVQHYGITPTYHEMKVILKYRNDTLHKILKRLHELQFLTYISSTQEIHYVPEQQSHFPGIDDANTITDVTHNQHISVEDKKWFEEFYSIMEECMLRSPPILTSFTAKKTAVPSALPYSTMAMPAPYGIAIPHLSSQQNVHRKGPL